MQFSIAALLVAATGALAAPDRGGKPSRPIHINNHNHINNNNNHQTVTITCTGGSSFCCSPEYGDDNAFSHFKCQSALVNSCNAGGVTVCCNQVAQGVCERK